MASLTMMTTSLFGASTTITKHNTARRGVIVAKASAPAPTEGENGNLVEESKTNNGRRDLVFAAAAAALCSVSKIAMADEPRRGSAEAKKKYGPVCITQPTARICHY